MTGFENMGRCIERQEYVERLAAAEGNGMVKIITGLRRCGKSHLLGVAFRKYLRENGVDGRHIHAVSLDLKPWEALQEPDRLYRHFAERIRADGKRHYVFIDEVQLCRKTLKAGADPSRTAPEDRDALYTTFHDTLNSLAALPGADVYVTGSNSRMLSKDVATQFRGRGWELRMRPLSFAEFLPVHGGEKAEAWEDYLAYGGLPQVALERDETEKRRLLAELFAKTYLRDIVERHGIRDAEALGRVADMLCSAVGSLTNPGRLANDFSSAWRGKGPTEPTLRAWLGHFEDAFLFGRADRWDVKGGRYLSSPSKWYATDTGLRNARTNFRQMEPTHLMENAIYNELAGRGYAVDVGVVESVESRGGGKQAHVRREIDFVVNTPKRRVYIQSAFALPDGEKRQRETAALRKAGGFSRKIVVTGGSEKPWTDEDGILYVGVIPFMLDRSLLEGW